MMHEVGHSLDAHAYPGSSLSCSPKWQAAYDQDSKVPDNYARTNFVEDVAQNTVIAAYDLNVPNGGLGTIQQDWHSIHNQYELVKKEQAAAGDLLKPGGKCTQRLNNSQPVKMSKARRAVVRSGVLPLNIDVHEEMAVVKRRSVPSESWARKITVIEGKPDVNLAKGLEVIEPGPFFSTEDTSEY